ncbi:MAG: hypothetical protein U0935_08095 [Pirellulales bacterium]
MKSIRSFSEVTPWYQPGMAGARRLRPRRPAEVIELREGEGRFAGDEDESAVFLEVNFGGAAGPGCRWRRAPRHSTFPRAGADDHTAGEERAAGDGARKFWWWW